MLNELVEFFKAAVVKQQFHAFARGEFTFAMLALAAFRPAALFRFSMTPAKLIETIHKPERIVCHPQFDSLLRVSFHAAPSRARKIPRPLRNIYIGLPKMEHIAH
jgi:hypothetical protein